MIRSLPSKAAGASLVSSSLPVPVGRHLLSVLVVQLQPSGEFTSYVEDFSTSQAIRKHWDSATYPTDSEAAVAGSRLLRSIQMRMANAACPQLQIVQAAGPWEHLQNHHGHARPIIGSDGQSLRVGVEFKLGAFDQSVIEWDSLSFASLDDAQDCAMAILDKRLLRYLPIRQELPAFLRRPTYEGQYRIVQGFNSSNVNVADRALLDAATGKLRWHPINLGCTKALAAMRGYMVALDHLQQNLIDTSPFTQEQFLQFVANRTAERAAAFTTPRELEAIDSLALNSTKACLGLLELPLADSYRALNPGHAIDNEHLANLVETQTLIGLAQQHGSGVVPQSLLGLLSAGHDPENHAFEIASTLLFYRSDLMPLITGLSAPVAAEMLEQLNQRTCTDADLMIHGFATWPSGTPRCDIARAITALSGKSMQAQHPVEQHQHRPSSQALG